MMVAVSERDTRVDAFLETLSWRLYGTTPGMQRKLTSTASITVD
jgi:hypothetical protein